MQPMTFLAKFFWPLIPVVLLFATYREANSKVLRYWAFSQDRDAVMDTQKDLNRIMMKVAINYRATQSLPNNLKIFLELMPSIEGARERAIDVDAWLVPYQLHDLGERYELVSCGPDRDCENEIDNLVEGAKKVKKGTTSEAGQDDKMDAVFKNLDKTKKDVESHNKQLEDL